MRENRVDIIIIGAGLGGLTAAYNLAEMNHSVIVFERSMSSGRPDHPCGAMISPIKGYASFKRVSKGIKFQEIDYVFKNEDIIAQPKKMEFVTPNGCKFGMEISDKSNIADFILQINKSNLLEDLKTKAEEKGAVLLYGHKVSDLIWENNKIIGVYVGKEKFYAKLIISAEGISRKFTNLAKLYKDKPENYLFVYSKLLDNLTLSEDEVGQIGYFGKHFMDIPNSSIIYHSLGNDKAYIMYSFIFKNFRWSYEQSISEIFDRTCSEIEFIRNKLKEGDIVKEEACWIIAQKPNSLTTDNFIGIGDTIAPIGHSSIIIAMLMGYKAANLCHQAIINHDSSKKFLKSFNSLLTSDLFKGVEFEAKLIINLLRFTDTELNQLCSVFRDINLEPFFIGSKWEIIKSSLKLMLKSKTITNWNLIKRLF